MSTTLPLYIEELLSMCKLNLITCTQLLILKTKIEPYQDKMKYFDYDPYTKTLKIYLWSDKVVSISLVYNKLPCISNNTPCVRTKYKSPRTYIKRSKSETNIFPLLQTRLKNQRRLTS